MAQISAIYCEVRTGALVGAGTDGSIYLGIGGREFNVDSDEDDFEQATLRGYIFGESPVDLGPHKVQVKNGDRNDPRKGFPIETQYLARSPVYVRFEPKNSGDNWNIKYVAVSVYTDQFSTGYTPPFGFDNLWIGQGSGKILYLTYQHDTSPTFRAAVETLAGRRA